MNVNDKIISKDCFIEKFKNWVWVIIVFVFGSIVYAIVTSLEQNAVYSAAERSASQAGQFQNAALALCPYCPGYLDAQGRCNVRECPIYSPNWGMSTSPRVTAVGGIPVKCVLLKPLALEVGASDGKGSVVIQSVYVGGNADKAGLKVGDRIVQFNGRKAKSVKKFRSIVALASPEVNVEIRFIRNQKKMKASVMVGEGEMEGATIPPPPNVVK